MFGFTWQFCCWLVWVFLFSAVCLLVWLCLLGWIFGLWVCCLCGVYVWCVCLFGRGWLIWIVVGSVLFGCFRCFVFLIVFTWFCLVVWFVVSCVFVVECLFDVILVLFGFLICWWFCTYICFAFVDLFWILLFVLLGLVWVIWLFVCWGLVALEVWLLFTGLGVCFWSCVCFVFWLHCRVLWFTCLFVLFDWFGFDWCFVCFELCLLIDVLWVLYCLVGCDLTFLFIYAVVLAEICGLCIRCLPYLTTFKWSAVLLLDLGGFYLVYCLVVWVYFGFVVWWTLLVLWFVGLGWFELLVWLLFDFGLFFDCFVELFVGFVYWLTVICVWNFAGVLLLIVDC